MTLLMEIIKPGLFSAEWEKKEDLETHCEEWQKKVRTKKKTLEMGLTVKSD